MWSVYSKALPLKLVWSRWKNQLAFLYQMLQDKMRAGIFFIECFNPVKLILECVYEMTYDSKSNKSVMEAKFLSFLYADVEIPFQETNKQTLYLSLR